MGRIVLYLVAKNGHEAVVKLLLNHGAEVKAAGNDGWTVLHSAALNGHEPGSSSCSIMAPRQKLQGGQYCSAKGRGVPWQGRAS